MCHCFLKYMVQNNTLDILLPLHYFNQYLLLNSLNFHKCCFPCIMRNYIIYLSIVQMLDFRLQANYYYHYSRLQIIIVVVIIQQIIMKSGLINSKLLFMELG